MIVSLINLTELREGLEHFEGHLPMVGCRLDGATVLALVVAVEAAQAFERAYQQSLASASAYDHEQRHTTQLALIDKLARFSSGPETPA